jgi:AbrB family looped-hinge helix DNA binding protein
MRQKGQITIPVAIRWHLGIKPGDYVRFEYDDITRELRLIPVKDEQ